MLSCIDLSLEFNNKLILDKFSVSVFPGSIHVLRGVNGSGKTSLIKVIAGLTKQNSGKILWNNKTLVPEHCLGYLGHENAIKANLSVLDNLLLWAELTGNHLLIPPALGQFKLTDKADIECKYLSAGWQRRVSLARMIISNKKLWLLDEPEANLDQEGRELLLKLLQIKIQNGGMAIIATHNCEYYKNISVINIDDFKAA